MDGTTPLLSPSVPRFAPPRTHTRTPSRSPTRHRLADDVLSDLSPATTLEAFTNPSGKLKASIEAATPSERAFGLRATLASKKIQEWVDELSGWPWPAEGGSIGFEIPSAKRRKLSLQPDDRGRRNSNGYTQEPNYIGSILETEVDRYENRIDDITADMEDLNVEEIKRQVLDTHFSPRSRPSSSASNAPPMPSLFASYTRMDDFTAVITATVLHSLPNLSRLTRLMDVWNIRLSVLRKVPPLMTALDDVEIALKSGWTAIDTQDSTPPNEDPYLSRKTFEAMRNVLQDKVTTLGQDLDYMLDTLEGREDTLPDIWLDRMETIENDYGSWVVSGDRKVREGEWARMAKARKEEDDARKLKEAEVAETARRKAEEEARRRAQLDAEEAEAARLKLEQEAQEAARLQAEEAEAAALARQKADEDAKEEAARLEALRKAEELEMEKLLAEQKLEAEAARLEAEEEVREVAKHKTFKEAEEIKVARLLAEQQAESARLAEEEAQELARQKALQEARHTEEARLLAERKAEIATLQAEREAQEVANRKALDEAAQVEAAGLLAEQQAQAEFARLQAQELQATQEQALRDAEVAEAARVAEEVARQQVLKAAREAEETKLLAQQQAEESERQAAADLAIFHAERDADETAMRKAKLEAENAESWKRDQAELARQTAEQEAESARKQAQLEVKPTTLTSSKDTSDVESAQQSEVASAEVFQQQQAEHNPETSKTMAQPNIAVTESAGMKPTLMEMTSDELVNKRISDCDICEEIRQSKPNSPSQPVMGAAVSSGAARTKNYVDSLITTDFDDAVNPQITRYAPFDGGYESSEPAIRTTEVEIKKPSNGLDLASPIHLDDSFPQTPTSSTVSSAARVYTSPTSEESSPPRSKVLPFGHGFASIVRVSSPVQDDRVVQPTEQKSTEHISKARPASQTPVRSTLSFDGANDVNNSDQATSRTIDEEWVVVKSPGDSSIELPADVQDNHSDPESTNSRSSVVFDYSTSEPTPEIYEAQPAEYFASPAKTQPSTNEADFTPSGPLPVTPKPLAYPDAQTSTPRKSPVPVSNRHSRESTNSILSPVAEEFMSRSTELDVDGSCDACEVAVRDLESSEKESDKETDLPVLAHKTSISRIDSPIRRISIPRRESISSDASTIIHGRVGGSPSSTVASPISEDATELSVEQSPSAGRIGHRSVKSYDISPPNSPPPGIVKRPSLFLPTTPSSSGSTAPSTPLADSTPQTPLDAPVFGNVDVSTVPIIASPKKSNSDDQMQQQISSLLESIPARIRLTTESDSTPFASQTLRPKKTRRSITPSFRSSSSMSNYSTSSRAPTPSFTLAPAFGKTSSRPRPQSSNPEIKLYHLSRSTGEAPIKLFVRLVGEHGERVMVRVGGGWADLGEYLKEYASHHGRRSGLDTGDKVQIQDLPSRNVSSSSTVTLRGNANGRSTPDPRPQSVMERERPGSSLVVRKTRRSIGGDSSSSSPTTSASASDKSLAPRVSDAQSRAPSTPLPSSSLHRNSNNIIISTPPSTTSSTSASTSATQDRDRDRQPRSSSRLSWTSDDTSLPLGLAGPKSKNITISERDQEWVESMKEKVRLASAEKERRERDSGVGLNMGMGSRGKGEGSGGRESRASFGEMEKVGGTKRLFRKGL
ncbi:hypothetical protein DL95DRAFT_386350 [Leptodontidium sp. 2 PMI_412]|nr:hypothetical protein DL95DRAFT_386350 [Leptodontidium sp. 2 PMI_412]